jgi:hypothetical protein
MILVLEPTRSSPRPRERLGGLVTSDDDLEGEVARRLTLTLDRMMG